MAQLFLEKVHCEYGTYYHCTASTHFRCNTELWLRDKLNLHLVEYELTELGSCIRLPQRDSRTRYIIL